MRNFHAMGRLAGASDADRSREWSYDKPAVAMFVGSLIDKFSCMQQIH